MCNKVIFPGIQNLHLKQPILSLPRGPIRNANDFSHCKCLNKWNWPPQKADLSKKLKPVFFNQNALNTISVWKFLNSPSSCWCCCCCCFVYNGQQHLKTTFLRIFTGNIKLARLRERRHKKWQFCLDTMSSKIIDLFSSLCFRIFSL